MTSSPKSSWFLRSILTRFAGDLTKKRAAAGLSQIYGPKAVESGLSQAKGNISFLEGSRGRNPIVWMGQPARLGFLPLFLAVEVLFGEFPDEALLAVLAVELGAAALHAPLAHI